MQVVVVGKPDNYKIRKLGNGGIGFVGQIEVF